VWGAVACAVTATAVAAGAATASSGPERVPGPVVMVAAPAAVTVPAVPPVPAVPSPAESVRETGTWFAHGYTLELLPDGTGTFAVWMGAFDGTVIRLRLIPAPGEATVAEVVGVETVGGGALAPGATPGIGGLVTIDVGPDIRVAHVEWSSGPDRLSADLCPTEGLDAATMAMLHCGA
jgi:hypothetical protein